MQERNRRSIGFTEENLVHLTKGLEPAPSTVCRRHPSIKKGSILGVSKVE